jgi:hypothetical protein
MKALPAFKGTGAGDVAAAAPAIGRPAFGESCHEILFGGSAIVDKIATAIRGAL